jgi:hypothetical protein
VSKTIVLMLFAMLALSGLVMVGCASAQFVQTPSVPEFTVELVDSSYDEPTTYFTDPYTGETVTHEGYHVYRQNIELKIKNQPFTPYTETGGQNIDFYYNIRIKGHFTGIGLSFTILQMAFLLSLQVQNILNFHIFGEGMLTL